MAEDSIQLQNRIAELEAKVARLETTLLLMPDVYRFQPLQELLAAGDFREADKETIRVIISITGVKDIESITPNDVLTFPCNQLQVIDRLWIHYSQGKFGFSIQAQLYQEVGGSIDTTIAQDNSVIEKLGLLNGWRLNNKWQKCDELDYTLNAPKGCHPSRWWNSPFGSKMTNYFFNRLITCQI